MLHGFPEYSGAFSALAAHLSQHFYCIAPDQRGFGQTGGPKDVSAYRTSALADDMAALIGNGPVTVLGHDWGAAVAYGLAMWHPALVDRLIIMNGVHPAPFQKALARGGAQSAASQYITALRQEGYESHLAEDDFRRLFRFFSANMDMSWMTSETAEDYRREWARPGRLTTMLHWYRASPLKIAAPGHPVDMPDLPVDRLHVSQDHLLIWGMKDTALLPEATDGLEAFAPKLTRVEIENADHWLAHQHPKEIADIILNWMRP